MISRRDAGFSLVEVALALGVASFCLISLLGLLLTGLNSDRSATEETATINIATTVTNDLKSARKMAGVPGTSPLYGLPLPAAASTSSPPAFVVTQTGQKVAQGDPTARYLVTVTMTAPGNAVTGAGQVQPTFVDIRVSWPAAASLPNAAGSTEAFTALDRW